MRSIAIKLAVAVLCVFVQLASADIVWDQDEFSYTARPDEGQVVASYNFTNKADDSVTITRVKTSCGCSTPKLEKRTYGPGEQGTLEVLFQFGDRVGPQTKSIYVYTDHSPEVTKKLILRVDIPQPFKVWPKLVQWPDGVTAEPKKVHVQFDHASPVQITDIQLDQSQLQFEIQTIDPGKEYELVLTPTLSDEPRPPLIPITLVSNLPYEKTRIQKIFARVP